MTLIQVFLKASALVSLVSSCSVAAAPASAVNAVPMIAATPSAAELQRKNTLREKLRSHQARSITFWNRFMLKPFDERFGAAPAPFVDLLTIDNELSGRKERPRAREPDPTLVRDIKKALIDLPPRVKILLRDKFLGVYFVEDLGGSGITEFVRDGKGKEAFGVVAMDVKAMNRTANEWASWKESTPYKQDPLVKVEATLEEHIYNDRASALQYLLLHELGHVLAIGRADLVSEATDLSKPLDLSSRPFVALTWQYANGRWATRFDRTTYPQRLYLSYYGAASGQLPTVSAVQTLKNIEKTNLPSPYAGLSPDDDFAESFASYVHTQWMRKPWSIRYVNQGKVEFELKPCWDLARCEERQRLLEKILSEKPQ